MSLTKKDKNKLKTRKGKLNFIAYCKIQEGIPWFHWRYVTSKKLSDKELEHMCKDHLFNLKNGIQYLKEMKWGKRGYEKDNNGYWKKS